jgi:hypothetical protein
LAAYFLGRRRALLSSGRAACPARILTAYLQICYRHRNNLRDRLQGGELRRVLARRWPDAAKQRDGFAVRVHHAPVADPT